MFKKKNPNFKEVDELKLKALKRFEYVVCDTNKVGCEVTYLRVPGGLIRTVSTPECVSQQFIEIPISFFTNFTNN